jgi:mono/diheme cytochrome c family protein
MKTMVRASLMVLAGTLALSTVAFADAAADYKAKCAACHGADGKGNAAMKTKDLGSADVQAMSDADLAGVITKGKKPMPGYEGKLTADQINDLVKWIRTLKK